MKMQAQESKQVENCWVLDALLFYAYKLHVYVFTWRVCLSAFREPKVWDSLSWWKQRSQNLLPILAAVSSFNKFDNDGSFMHKFLRQQNEEANKLMVRVTGISKSHPN